MKSEILALDRVFFSYAPDRTALRDVSLSLRPGQWLAVMGENGSGKSTLAKLAAGLALPDQGSVQVRGIDTTDDRFSACRRYIGYLSQQPEDHIVGLTVGDDVAFGPRNLGMPEAIVAKRVRRALDAVGLSDMTEAATNRLSGGELQRVALAGVLAVAPKLLILDEPTSQCDPPLRAALTRWVQDYMSQGDAAVLWVTHDPAEAALANRVVVLSEGRVVFEGEPEELQYDTWGLEAAWPDSLGRVNRSPGLPTKAQGTALRMKNVEFSYGQRAVLRGVNLRVRYGEVVALRGRSGAGKSTLLQIAALLERPERGELEVAGETVPTAMKTRRARRELSAVLSRLRPAVAVAFQQPEQQLFGLTVRDDFYFGLKHLGIPVDSWDERICHALDLVSLPREVLDRSPFALSGGERRRVAIALGFAQRPRLFVMDEPAAGLDFQSRKRLMAAVQQAVAGGDCAILFSTHDPEIAQAWGQRTLQLVDGRVSSEGDSPGWSDQSAAFPDPTGQEPAKASDTPDRPRTWLSRVDARVRLVGAGLIAGVVATAGGLAGLVAAGGVVALLSAWARVPGTDLWLTARGLLPFVLVAAIFSAGGSALAEATTVWAGLAEGGRLGARMLLLVFSVHWLTRTAGVSELLSALRSLMRPLNRLGLPVESLATAGLLAVRMIPVLGDEARRIHRAQLARGVGRTRGLRGLWLRVVSLVVPLSAAGLRRAERLGEALVTRGYHGGGLSARPERAALGRAEGVFIAAVLVGAALIRVADRLGG